MEKYTILYTVYYYEKVNEEYVMKHYNDLMFASNYSHAARILEEECPEAEKIEMQMFDGCIIIPDDKMEVIKEILAQ